MRYGRQFQVPFAESVDCPQSPIMFPVAVRMAAWKTKTGEYRDIENHRALVRVNGGEPHVLSVVTDSYKLVHNRELFAEINDAIETLVEPENLTDAYCVDAISHSGRNCLRQYMFPSLKCTVNDGVSKIAFRLIIQNGYGGSALRGHGGAIDFFCTNGMVRGVYESLYRRHTSGLVIERATDMVKSALLTYTEAASVWQDWAARSAEREQTMAMFRSFTTSDSLYDKLLNQWMLERETRGDTLWSAYSTLTHYASHVEDGEFAMRAGSENGASTQLSRELAVSKFVTSPVWQRLVEA